MEYLKRVFKVLKESHWASPGEAIKFAFQVLLTVIVIGGATYGIDTLVQMLIKF